MRRARVAALALLTVVLAGCDDPTAQTGQTDPRVPVPTYPSSSSAPPAAQSTTTDDGDARPDELARGSARHVVRADGLTVTIDYTVATPVDWTSDAGTPLQIVVSARDSRDRKLKIYLSKATIRYIPDEGASGLPDLDPAVDTANIDPGFLVTSPYQYQQSFTVPGIDPSTRSLAIVSKLELVTLVDKKAKDYTKQAVTDRLSTTVG